MKQILRAVVLAVALSTSSVFAQGKIQFTWHGDQNLFQASFDIDSSVLLLPPNGEESWHYAQNVDFDNEESGLYQSFTITTAPLGTFYGFDPYAPAGVFASGVRNGELILDVWGHDPNPGDNIYLLAWASRGQIRDGTSPGGFEIYNIGEVVTPLVSERGYWSWPLAPEPSSFALLGLGLLGLCVRKAAK
jgi:hypothetical protein